MLDALYNYVTKKSRLFYPYKNKNDEKAKRSIDIIQEHC